jgi:AcrR family transcriptional regulator
MVRTFSKNDELTKERRRYITDQAVKLFLKKGSLRTTIREIAETCNIGIGTLYHYIGAKDDILQLASENVIDDYHNLFLNLNDKYHDLQPSIKLVKIIDFYFRLVDLNQDVIVFWTQETKNLKLEDRQKIFDIADLTIKEIKNILDQGCEQGEFDIDDTALLATNIMTLGDIWASMRWRLRKIYTLDEYIAAQTKIILKSTGLFRNKSEPVK